MGNRTKRSYCQYGRTSAPSLSSKYHQATLQCLAVIAHWALPKKANGGRARAAVQVATSSTHPGGVDRGDLASRHRRGKGEKRRGRRAAARPRQVTVNTLAAARFGAVRPTRSIENSARRRSHARPSKSPPRASHLHARPPEAIRTKRIRVFAEAGQGIASNANRLGSRTT